MHCWFARHPRRIVVKRLVAARGRYRLEFLNEQYQWNAHQHEPAERSEAIQKRQKGRLAFQESERLRLRVNHGVGMREAMSRKIIGEVAENSPVMLIGRNGVRHEHALMILRAACQQRGDESNSETASLVAEQIGEAGGLVVFVLRQIGIG